jgi:O-antigen ligase
VTVTEDQRAASVATDAEAWPVIATIGLCLYIYVAAVGVLPFADRRLGVFTDASDGNVIKQVLALGAFVAVLAGTPSAIFRLPAIVPPLAVVLFGWCLVTLTWSPAPDIGFRRIILTALSVLVVFTYASSYGVKRLWQVLTWVFAALVFGSLLSGVLVPAAIHQPEDPETGLAGDWRGLLFHKNGTGFVAATAAIIFLWRWVESRRAGDGVALFASLLLLVLSGAKTSMIALPVAILVAMGLHYFIGRLIGRPWLFILSAVAVLIVAMLIQGEWELIEKFLDNPTGLTGRTAIWSALLQVARGGAWVFGTGFASLFGVGDATPLAPYLDGWLLMAGHGHNGYLELLISVGVPGVVLAVVAFMVMPLWALMGPTGLSRSIHMSSLSCLVFIAIHNLSESSLMDRSHIAWVVLLFVAATAAQLKRQDDPIS